MQMLCVCVRVCLCGYVIIMLKVCVEKYLSAFPFKYTAIWVLYLWRPIFKPNQYLQNIILKFLQQTSTINILNIFCRNKMCIDLLFWNVG